MTTTHPPTPQPACAHLRVSYRTEQFRAEVAATADYPGGMQTLTRGWWECDSHCGAKFTPVAAVARRSPEGAEPSTNAAAERDMAERALAWLTSRDTIRDVQLRDSLNEALQTRFGSWPMQVYALAVALRAASPTREPTP